MKIETHQINNIKIAEVIANTVFIKTAEDGLDLLGNLYYSDFDKIIIHQKNLTTDFFDLQNGIAGEILQKFSNYRVRLVIVGDYSKYVRKSVNDFIYESNKDKQVNFVATLPEAIKALSDQQI